MFDAVCDAFPREGGNAMSRSGGELLKAIRSNVILEGTLILLAVIVAAYLVMLFANFWPPKEEQQCAWQFPKVLSCVLGMRENLAGGVLGAAGAIFAAWIAWRVVQSQVIFAASPGAAG